MNERLGLGSLALELLKRLRPGEGPVPIPEIHAGYPSGILREKLAEMAERGLLGLDGERVAADAAQRLELALFAVESGVRLDSIGKAMDWRGFEDFAEEILRNMGFRCIKHLRFKGRRRAEVDLLAIGPLFALSIDCKRWRRASEGAISRAAAAQGRRTRELLEWLRGGGLGPAMGLPDIVPLWPILLTLQDHRIKAVGGVAIVPISKLRDFVMRADPSGMGRGGCAIGP